MKRDPLVPVEENFDEDIVCIHSHRSAEAPKLIHPTKRRNNAKKEFLARMARLREEDNEVDYERYEEKAKGEKPQFGPPL